MFREQDDGEETLEEDPTNVTLSEAAATRYHQSRQERSEGRNLLHSKLESHPDDDPVQGVRQQTEKLCSEVWRKAGTPKL